MRTLAREAALKLIFSKIFDNTVDQETKLEVFKELGLDQKAADFANRLLANAHENFENYSQIAASFSNEYSLDRIFAVDRCAIVLAIAEMQSEDVPAAVTINEYVNLVRKYSTENSVVFVNGILAAYKKFKENQ